MIDLYATMKDLFGVLTKANAAKRSRIQHASNLVSEVYNNAEKLSSTFDLMKVAASDVGLIELNRDYNALRIAIKNARNDPCVSEWMRRGRDRQARMRETEMRYGVPETSGQSRLRERDIGYDLIIIWNSADWMAAAFGLRNDGGGVQLSSYPPRDMSEAAEHLRFTWVDIHIGR
ncbi:MAG: hypothetical protein ACRDS0_25430 [Pseudonocardiaceae bacterium]